MQENRTIPWVEKYRPTRLEDIVLEPINRQIFENILKTRYFPNLLFYGPPGTGKTSTILNLIQNWNLASSDPHKRIEDAETSGSGSSVGKDTETKRRNQMKERVNIIHLNASDERGIDIIRNQILQFVQTKSLFETGMKFVILDEVDYMTKPAQQAFKYLLQSFSSHTFRNVRFCLICNYLSKIDESLRHEFMTIRFNQLPQKQIHAFIHSIAEQEGIRLGLSEIETIQQIYKSDIRSMINFIQMNQDVLMMKQSILTDAVWEEFHRMCFHRDGEEEEGAVEMISSEKAADKQHERRMKCKLQEMSIQYNMDKKHLLKRYFHFLVQKGYGITVDNLSVIRNIVHYVESTAEQQLVYFLHHYST
jgi:replication factor C subunit 3/5